MSAKNRVFIGWAVKSDDGYLCVDEDRICFGQPEEKVLFRNLQLARDAREAVHPAWFDGSKIVRVYLKGNR